MPRHPLIGHAPSDFGAPLLICADLQKDHLFEASLGRDGWGDAFAHCQSLLDQWRHQSWPIAHLKRVGQSALCGTAAERDDWIDTFRPRPGELIFEHILPSAYSSGRFVEFMRGILPPSHFLVGCSLDRTILSTVIEGYHRGYHHCVVEDATICAGSMHRSAVVDTATLFGLVDNFGNRKRAASLIAGH